MDNGDHGASSYQRFLQGDDEGLVEMIRDYKDGLIFFLNRYVNNIHTAEELAEDTFFRIVTKKPRFTPTYSFKTWLYTIARNSAINYMKREAKHTCVDDVDLLSKDEASLERAYLQEERKITIHRALSHINRDYGTVLYLKFFEKLSNEQLARVMRKSKRQIENLLYQSKQALRTQLKKEGFTDEDL